MVAFQKKRFEVPDKRDVPPNARIEPVTFGSFTPAKATYSPGWRWPKDIRPIAGTASCQKHHFGYCLSGRLAGRLDDGSAWEFGPGDVFEIPAGHDGWVVGDEPPVTLEVVSE